MSYLGLKEVGAKGESKTGRFWFSAGIRVAWKYGR